MYTIAGENTISQRKIQQGKLHVEPEQDDVAVLDAPTCQARWEPPNLFIPAGRSEFVRPNSSLRVELTRQKARDAIAPCRPERRENQLHVETEQDDVAVLDDIFLAFGADQALLTAAAIVPQAIRSS